ncbi:hypothetical protein BLX91_01250 [Bacillus subtilis]|nr:hypothetical protein BLX91_01250 [Bacillus subtilis]
MRRQLNMNGSKKISDMIQIEPFLINQQKSRGQAALLFIYLVKLSVINSSCPSNEIGSEK